MCSRVEGKEPWSEGFCWSSCQPVGDFRIGNHVYIRIVHILHMYMILKSTSSWRTSNIYFCHSTSPPWVPLQIQLCFFFLHYTMPGTRWKENSAIIPKRVATVQLCGLRENLVAFFYLSFSKIISMLF